MARPRVHLEPRKPYLVRLPVNLYKALQHLRIDTDAVSLNQVIVDALQEWLAAKKIKTTRAKTKV